MAWGARNLISAQVLQDIHWSFGAVGYFPSSRPAHESNFAPRHRRDACSMARRYTLGAIMAAQIFAAADLGLEVW